MTLVIEDLGVRLGDRWILRDVGLACAAGEVVAVCGDNGAGKSTLLGAVAGVVPIARGVALLDGVSLAARGGRARRQLGFVPEAADLPPHLAVREVLALVAAVRRAAPLDEAARRRLFPAALEAARVGGLSLGERRRVGLAAALIGPPRALVLDEPDAGLDAAGLELLAAIVRERAAAGAAVLLASHDGALLDRLGARRVALAAGRVVAQ